MSASQSEETDALSDPEERRVLYATLDSFRQYRRAAHYNVTHLRRQSFYSLPSAHLDILCEPPFSLPATFNAVDDAIDCNAELSEAILQVGLASFGVDGDDETWKGQATPSDLDKAQSTIRQFYRDWSAEGDAERKGCSSPILSALATHLPSDKASARSMYNILVPGAGLGRLVFEICAEGYTVEGNEISYHQLLASSYILNYVQSARQHQLFPWALGFSNHLSRQNQLQQIFVPDVHPESELNARSDRLGIETPYSERMSMSAGDFCEIYRRSEYKNSFDAVTTCFFIDTAPNAINYVATIKHCLKPGGVWINLGPLLWHFESEPTPAEQEDTRRVRRIGADGQALESKASTQGSLFQGIGEPGSFELSNDEVMALVSHFGMEFVEHRNAPTGQTGYIQDPNSMLQKLFRPAFWVAKKPKERAI